MQYDLLIKNGFLIDGYRYTVVNGQVLLRDGEPTGACPGRVLRSYEQ